MGIRAANGTSRTEEPPRERIRIRPSPTYSSSSSLSQHGGAAARSSSAVTTSPSTISSAASAGSPGAAGPASRTYAIRPEGDTDGHSSRPPVTVRSTSAGPPAAGTRTSASPPSLPPPGVWAARTHTSDRPSADQAGSKSS